jgi:flagellar basal-body rod protein FlgB
MADDLKMLNYLESGIKAEGLRQKAIANNVANMNTPGYRRTDLNFDDVLSEAIEAQENGRSIDVQSLKGDFYQPMNTPVDSKGNDVSLDHEVGQMVKNSVRHQTYMLLLKKKYEQINLATRI